MNDCPLNEAGHRFFVFKTFEAYEHYTGAYEPLPFKQGEKAGTLGARLYEKVEYAILGCNCGQVIKRVVKSD